MFVDYSPFLLITFFVGVGIFLFHIAFLSVNTNYTTIHPDPV